LTRKCVRTSHLQVASWSSTDESKKIQQKTFFVFCTCRDVRQRSKITWKYLKN